VPTQEGAFSDHQPRLIAEYGTIMRRIPLFLRNEGPFVGSVPTARPSQTCPVERLNPLKVVRLSCVWGIARNAENNSSVWLMIWDGVARRLLLRLR
jgi:hypothetical protein